MRVRTPAVLVLVVAGLVAPAADAGILKPRCPATIDPTAFASAAALRAGNQVMADAGPRPTAGPAHTGFVEWVDGQLHGIGGLQISDLPITIDRQLETGASLSVGGVDLPVAGAVPFSTLGTVTAPLVEVPTGTPIAGADVAGKIVVRDAPPSLIQNAVFAAVAYFVYDPALSFDYAGNYERDWLGAGQRIIDLTDAQNAGAAGLVFVSELPRDQIQGSYVPYPGVPWNLIAAYLGADEGAVLKATQGPATLTVSGTRQLAPTRTIVARLPGRSTERIVVESHTDGMNAVWDNGPIALLAMARYFASLPIECRPRTIEFVFTTAHLYLSQAGAYQYAEILDDDYDTGTVALVVALEHLGAREYEAVPRTDGPGRRLQPTGKSEMFAIFSMESPVLVQGIVRQVVAHDLKRSWVLRGADAPQAGFPPHRSFGGEGGPYREQIVPTVAAITGPWTLFDPAFGMELVDFELMRRQTLAFGDLILAVDDVPRTLIAGADTAYRLGRATTAYCTLGSLAAMASTANPSAAPSIAIPGSATPATSAS